MQMSEMVEAVAEATGTPKAVVASILRTFLKETLKAVGSGEKVSLTNFGVFFKKEVQKKQLFGKPKEKGEWAIIKFKPSRKRRSHG